MFKAIEKVMGLDCQNAVTIPFPQNFIWFCHERAEKGPNFFKKVFYPLCSRKFAGSAIAE
jgi:hypothetical protein